MFTFSSQYQGIFHNQSGYINVTMLMIGLLRIIDQNPNIIIRQEEEFLSLKLHNQIQILTNRGVLHASQKVLFVPGPYIKNISRLLNFDLNVTLWELPVYYFRRLPNAPQFPTWFTVGDNHRQSLFAGFSIDSTSDYIVITPKFIQNMSNSLIYPSQQTNIIDPFLTQKVIKWVLQHMRMLVNISDYYSNNRTCLATFLPDNGFLLDYVPRKNNRVLIQGAGWGMKFVPIWADILSDMILFEMNSSAQYAEYMNYFSLSRSNRLIEELIKPSKGCKFTSSLLFLFCLIILFN